MGWRDSIKAQAPNFPRIRRYPVTIQTKPTDQGEKEPQDPSSVSIVSGLPHNAGSETQEIGSPETDNATSIVSIVSDSQHLSGNEDRGGSDSLPLFTIGEEVTYQHISFMAYDPNDLTPEPIWEQRTGTVQGYDHLYELVKIRPDDPGEGVVQIAQVYVKKKVPGTHRA